MLSLQGDLRTRGLVALNSALAHAGIAQGAIDLVAIDGTRLRTACSSMRRGCTPLNLRQFADLDPVHVPEPRFAKGNYFTSLARPLQPFGLPCARGGGLGRASDAGLGRAGQIWARCAVGGLRR
jgi:hypothetical protein